MNYANPRAEAWTRNITSTASHAAHWGAVTVALDMVRAENSPTGKRVNRA